MINKGEIPTFPNKGANTSTCRICDGMTLHQWYAGQALAGLLAMPKRNNTPAQYASEAFMLATAMLKEGER